MALTTQPISAQVNQELKAVGPSHTTARITEKTLLLMVSNVPDGKDT